MARTFFVLLTPILALHSNWYWLGAACTARAFILMTFCLFTDIFGFAVTGVTQVNS
jgi:hypothetical protein